MEIHRYEKIWLAASVVLIVGFISTVAYGAVGAGVEMVNDQGGTINPEDVSDEFQPGVECNGDRCDVRIVARQFAFQPGSTPTYEPVVVPAGSTVTFHITSPDVIHGFELAGTNVNTMIIPGQIAEITAEFEEPAEYGIICHEYCGAGHHTMAGTMRVVPESEYDYEKPQDADSTDEQGAT